MDGVPQWFVSLNSPNSFVNSVSLVGNKLYVSGPFSTSLTVPGLTAPLTVANAGVFIMILDPATGQAIGNGFAIAGDTYLNAVVDANANGDIAVGVRSICLPAATVADGIYFIHSFVTAPPFLYNPLLPTVVLDGKCRTRRFDGCSHWKR